MNLELHKKVFIEDWKNGTWPWSIFLHLFVAPIVALGLAAGLGHLALWLLT